MRTTASFINAARAAAVLFTALALSPTLAAADEKAKTPVEQGRELAFNNKKGNCLACHYIDGGELPGNIGPALIMMKQRFQTKEELRKQIFDASVKNPNTMMPPFGRHAILSDEELDKIVEFVYSL